MPTVLQLDVEKNQRDADKYNADVGKFNTKADAFNAAVNRGSNYVRDGALFDMYGRPVSGAMIAPAEIARPVLDSDGNVIRTEMAVNPLAGQWVTAQGAPIGAVTNHPGEQPVAPKQLSLSTSELAELENPQLTPAEGILAQAKGYSPNVSLADQASGGRSAFYNRDAALREQGILGRTLGGYYGK